MAALLQSTIPLLSLSFTGLYYTLPWSYCTLLHTMPLLDTILHSTMAVLSSTGLYNILPWLYLAGSTGL